eukprot:37344-Pleurochrysis_carterae.AAC.1
MYYVPWFPAPTVQWHFARSGAGGAKLKRQRELIFSQLSSQLHKIILIGSVIMPAMQPAIRSHKIQCAAEDVIALATIAHMAVGSAGHIGGTTSAILNLYFTNSICFAATAMPMIS